MVCSSSVLTAPGLLLTLALVFFFLLPTVLAQDLLATLDYGTFQGAYDSTYNISYWQKIPFAQPPLGPLRFRGPQPPAPLANGTVYNSTQAFDMCVQRTVNGTEDCLYLGLYSRPWTAGRQQQQQPLRPVVVVFYGGAYIQGSASFTTLPPSAYPVLNVSGGTELVFVYANYRTNAFGFLPGREIGADRTGSDLNPGLLDQDAAIKCKSQPGWLKKGSPLTRAHSRDQEIHLPLRRRSISNLHLGPVSRRRLSSRPSHRPRRPPQAPVVVVVVCPKHDQ